MCLLQYGENYLADFICLTVWNAKSVFDLPKHHRRISFKTYKVCLKLPNKKFLKHFQKVFRSARSTAGSDVCTRCRARAAEVFSSSFHQAGWSHINIMIEKSTSWYLIQQNMMHSVLQQSHCGSTDASMFECTSSASRFSLVQSDRLLF